MIWIIGALSAAAAAYQIIAAIACIRQAQRRDAEPDSLPGMSILKPVHGEDPQMGRAIRSNLDQEYPRFEVLCGVSDENDPAVAALGFRVQHCPTRTPNGKVGVLIDLNRSAQYPIRVIADSDITVGREYLRSIAAGLEQPAVGLVTCLYRANASGLPGCWEALGIATDFVPSVLVAPLFGVNEFALGSTMAVRADDIVRIGGLETISEYIADDYQLGKRISALGRRVWLTRMVVDTEIGAEGWRDVWKHQVRWARTIRLSRGAYAGLPITNASLWALLLAATGQWPWALALVTLRYVTGLTAGLAVLDCGVTRRYWPLMPLRDLFGFGVWVAGMFGNRVAWRDLLLSLDRAGRIVQVTRVREVAEVPGPSE